MSSKKLTLSASAQRVLAVATAGALLPLGLAGAASAQTAPPGAVDISTNACPDDQVMDAGYTDIATVSDDNQLAINCISDYGLAQGTSDTTYNPTGGVNRSQMALFLSRYADYAGLELDTSDAGFTDISGEGAEAQAAINAVANLGIAAGKTDTTYAPGDGVSRAQMASFINRLQAAIEGHRRQQLRHRHRLLHRRHGPARRGRHQRDHLASASRSAPAAPATRRRLASPARRWRSSWPAASRSTSPRARSTPSTTA